MTTFLLTIYLCVGMPGACDVKTAPVVVEHPGIKTRQLCHATGAQLAFSLDEPAEGAHYGVRCTQQTEI